MASPTAHPAASAASPTAASVVAETAVGPQPQLRLGSDAMTVGFSWAGAALLLVLVVLAVVAHAFGRARRGVGTATTARARAPAWLARFSGSRMDARLADGLNVESSVRLDANTQLHVVSWRQQQWLVASSTQGGATLVDRLSPNASSPTEGAR